MKRVIGIAIGLLAAGVAATAFALGGSAAPESVNAFPLPGAATALRGTEILVPREALPPPAPGEYYWVDLEGLRVVTVEGVTLGEVSHLLSTGANDVMVVRGERERMLPFVQPDYVKSVDFESGTITGSPRNRLRANPASTSSSTSGESVTGNRPALSNRW